MITWWYVGFLDGQSDMLSGKYWRLLVDNPQAYYDWQAGMKAGIEHE